MSMTGRIMSCRTLQELRDLLWKVETGEEGAAICLREQQLIDEGSSLCVVCGVKIHTLDTIPCRLDHGIVCPIRS